MENVKQTNAPSGETELIVASTYRLTKRIFSGTFSEVRIGEHVSTKLKVAAKLEPSSSKLPQLHFEKKFYDLLKSENGFPIIHFYGQCPGYNVLVMQRLGQNLEQVFNLCKRQFSLKTIIYVAIQLITRFECIHRQGIVYRDVKPENFLLGLGSQAGTLHIIDFGLSKLYIDPNTRQHIPDQVRTFSRLGTVRYMSLNAHRSHEQSRRDDLEAVAYVLLYFLKQGKLPWSGMQGLSFKDRCQRILEYKYSIPIETLCHGFPVEFAHFLRRARALEFDEEPNYQDYQAQFVQLFKKENFRDDGVYDWTNKISIDTSEG